MKIVLKDPLGREQERITLAVGRRASLMLSAMLDSARDNVLWALVVTQRAERQWEIPL